MGCQQYAHKFAKWLDSARELLSHRVIIDQVDVYILLKKYLLYKALYDLTLLLVWLLYFTLLNARVHRNLCSPLWLPSRCTNWVYSHQTIPVFSTLVPLVTLAIVYWWLKASADKEIELLMPVHSRGSRAKRRLLQQQLQQRLTSLSSSSSSLFRSTAHARTVAGQAAASAMASSTSLAVWRHRHHPSILEPIGYFVLVMWVHLYLSSIWVVIAVSQRMWYIVPLIAFAIIQDLFMLRSMHIQRKYGIRNPRLDTEQISMTKPLRPPLVAIGHDDDDD